MPTLALGLGRFNTQNKVGNAPWAVSWPKTTVTNIPIPAGGRKHTPLKLILKLLPPKQCPGTSACKTMIYCLSFTARHVRCCTTPRAYIRVAWYTRTREHELSTHYWCPEWRLKSRSKLVVDFCPLSEDVQLEVMAYLSSLGGTRRCAASLRGDR